MKRKKKKPSNSPPLVLLAIFLMIVGGLLLLLSQNKKAIVQTTSTPSTNTATIETPIFEKSSIYEDLYQGYRFSYPDGFEVNAVEEGIELTPTTGKGKIVIRIEDQHYTTSVISADEQTELDTARDFINQSFEFFTPPPQENNKARFAK